MSELRFRVRSRQELLATPAPEFLVDQVIPEKSLIILFGPPGVGKTFVALDIALSICSGLNWMDYETLRGDVIYFTPEGLSGLKNRLLAWEAKNEKVADEFSYVCDAPQFLEADQVDEVINNIKYSQHPNPVLIVIDTLARHMVGGDENSSTYMGKFVANVDRLRAEFNCAVLVVHHTGKNSYGDFKERGSSALRGAADTMIMVESSDYGQVLTSEKQKDGAPFPQIGIQLMTVDLPNGHSSCVCVPIEISLENPNELSREKKNIIRCFFEHPDQPMKSAEIRSATGAKDSTFYRHLKELCKTGFVEKGDYQRYLLTERGKEYALTLKPLSLNSHENSTTTPITPTPL